MNGNQEKTDLVAIMYLTVNGQSYQRDGQPRQEDGQPCQRDGQPRQEDGQPYQELETDIWNNLMKERQALYYSPDDKFKNKISWRTYWTEGAVGRVVPFLFATTTGAHDYILILAATSTYVVTQFCSDVLRGREVIIGCHNEKDEESQKVIRNLGDKIARTHTTIAVNNDAEQRISQQLEGLLKGVC